MNKTVPSEFNTVALLGRDSNPQVADAIAELEQHLQQRHVDVVNLGDIENTRQQLVNDSIDLVIAVGGDGTMLRAANVIGTADIPLLGVNRGRLGFLADITPSVMHEQIDAVLDGHYTRDSRMRLQANLITQDGSYQATALNDVVLQRRDTGRTLDFESKIGDHYVNTHMGDGLIIATPTGSTAYALSCGGPIIEPHLSALLLVPICPHTLSDRPIVTHQTRPVVLTLLDREGVNAEVVADGRPIAAMQVGDTLEIAPSPSRVTLIHPPGYNYYEILRSKLHWGRDIRLQQAAKDE